MKNSYLGVLIFGVMVGLAAIASGQEITSTWSVSSGDWGLAGNWSNSPATANFPNNGNGGFNYDAVLGNGGTITLDQNISIDDFTMSEGTLAGGSYNLSMDGNLVWTGGSMEETGTTSVSGTGSTISGNASVGLDCVLNNSGTITDSQGGTNFYFDDNDQTPGVLNNSGTFNLTSGSGFEAVYSNAGNAINNTGVWNVSGGVSYVDSGVSFSNSGAVNVISGELVLEGNATSTSGTFAISAGANLEFEGGTYLMGNGTTFAGAGTVNLEGGTFSAGNSGSDSVSAQNFTIGGGTLTGSGAFSVTQDLNWTVGTMEGTGTTSVSGTASMSGDSSEGLDRVLNNNGTITDSQGGAYFYFDNNDLTPGVLNNSGTFNVTNGGGFEQLFSNTGNVINNTGVWNVSGAGMTSLVGNGLTFNNAGTVNVMSGLLELYSNVTSTSGTFLISGGASMKFVEGTDLIGNGTTFSGAGTVNLQGGTFSAGNSGSDSVSAQNFTMSGGTLTGSGAFSVTQDLNWTLGSMEGTGTTSVSGTASMSGDGTMGLDRVLNNSGTLTDSQGDAYLYFDDNDLAPGVLNNSGTFNVTNGGGFEQEFSNTGNAINNTGVWNVSGTTSIVGDGMTFNNTGTVDVKSGELALDGSITQHSGSTLTGGVWVVSNSSTLLFNDGGSAITTNDADVTLGGPDALFAAFSSVTTNNGAMRILGNASFSATGGFINAGTLQLGGGTFSAPSLVSNSGSEIFGYGAIGAPVQVNAWGTIEPGGIGVSGTLAIGGALSIEADANFVFNLNSTIGDPGSSEIIAASVVLLPLSQITFNDIAASPGALLDGDEFTVIETMNGITGTFGNLPDDSIFTVGSNTYEATYSSDDLVITVIPEPATWGMVISGLGMLICVRKLRSRPATGF